MNEPVSYSAEAVLTIQDVAKWLQVSTRMVERLNIKPCYLGDRTRRYLGKTVLEYLAEKEAA